MTTKETKRKRPQKQTALKRSYFQHLRYLLLVQDLRTKHTDMQSAKLTKNKRNYTKAHRQESIRTMFLRPEKQRCIQHHRIWEILRPQLCQPDPIIPHSSFRYQRHTQYPIWQQELNTFRHIRVESRWIRRIIHVLSTPLKPCNCKWMRR